MFKVLWVIYKISDYIIKLGELIQRPVWEEMKKRHIIERDKRR